MTVWFLAFLAVAWIVLYLPSVWRARQRSPFPAVQGFKRRMRLISPRSNSGRWVVVPDSRERVAQRSATRAQMRRKRVLSLLLFIAGITGIWALAAGGVAVEIHLITDAVAAFYIALMLDSRRRQVEREAKVRTLHAARPPSDLLDADPTFEVLEAGGGGRN